MIEHRLRCLLPIAALIGLTAAPVFAQSGRAEFAQFRGDQGHSGFVASSISKSLALAWQNTQARYSGNSSQPVVFNDTIVYGQGAQVFALSTIDGSIKWKYPNTVEANAGAFDAPVLYDNGKLYAGNDDGNIYCLDPQSGKVLWQAAGVGPVRFSPTIENGVLYFGSGVSLNAINAANGQPVWSAPIKFPAPITSSPTIAREKLIASDASGRVYSIIPGTARVVWSNVFSTAPDPGGVIAFNNRWIYLRAGRQILSITERGEVNTRWSVVSNISAPPTVGDDGTVYVASDDLNFSALDQRGKAIWTTKLDDVVIAPPLCTSDSIVICTNNGIIYSLDRSTGEKKWVYSIMPVFKSNIRGPRYAQVQIPPVVAGGNLYVLSDDGTLSAFRGDAPDDQSPVVNSLYPAPDDTISGVNIPWQIKVVDLGSGLKPSSPLLSVDGKDVPVEYDPATSSVHVKYVSNSSSIFKLPITLPTLSDGGHKAVLLLADWRGNTVAKIWQFTTDKNQLPPKNTAPAPKSLTNSNISQNSNIWALSDMGVSQPFDNAMLSLGGMFSPNMQGNAGGGGNGGSGGNGRSRGGGINGYGLPGPSQGTPSQGGGVLTITGTGTGGSGTTTVVTPPAPPK